MVIIRELEMEQTCRHMIIARSIFLDVKLEEDIRN